MTSLSLQEIARALGGQVVAGGVVAPGPRHSRKDRSLSIRPSFSSPDGFVVYSHAGDDFRDCRDYVAERLGISRDDRQTSRRREVLSTETNRRRLVQDDQARIARAVAIWEAATDPRGTIAERYLASRGLALDDTVSGHALRFHASCPWRDEERQVTIFTTCMVAAMRQVDGDRITAIHRTRLTPDGQKMDRRMLGIAAGAAIKLDPDEAVTGSLSLGEGIETAMSGRMLGFRPAWATGAAGGIASFPVICGVETLTLFGERDETNTRAAHQCGTRWHRDGREVRIIEPKIGKDLNDTIRGRA